MPPKPCIAPCGRGTNGQQFLPVSAASEAKQTHGRRCGNSFTIRDGNLSITESLVKTGFWLRQAPKRFSLWSLRGFFLTRQKEISQKDIAGTFVPAISLPRLWRGAIPAGVARLAALRAALCIQAPPGCIAQQQRGIQYDYHAAGVVYQRADDRVNHRGHCEDDRHEVQRHGEGEVALYREHHPL